MQIYYYRDIKCTKMYSVKTIITFTIIQSVVYGVIQVLYDFFVDFCFFIA